jgi:hypothetical protein
MFQKAQVYLPFEKQCGKQYQKPGELKCKLLGDQKIRINVDKE